MAHQLDSPPTEEDYGFFEPQKEDKNPFGNFFEGEEPGEQKESNRNNPNPFGYMAPSDINYHQEDDRTSESKTVPSSPRESTHEQKHGHNQYDKQKEKQENESNRNPYLEVINPFDPLANSKKDDDEVGSTSSLLDDLYGSDHHLNDSSDNNLSERASTPSGNESLDRSRDTSSQNNNLSGRSGESSSPNQPEFENQNQYEKKSHHQFVEPGNKFGFQAQPQAQRDFVVKEVDRDSLQHREQSRISEVSGDSGDSSYFFKKEGDSVSTEDSKKENLDPIAGDYPTVDLTSTADQVYNNDTYLNTDPYFGYDDDDDDDGDAHYVHEENRTNRSRKLTPREAKILNLVGPCVWGNRIPLIVAFIFCLVLIMGLSAGLNHLRNINQAILDQIESTIGDKKSPVTISLAPSISITSPPPSIVISKTPTTEVDLTFKVNLTESDDFFSTVPTLSPSTFPDIKVSITDSQQKTLATVTPTLIPTFHMDSNENNSGNENDLPPSISIPPSLAPLVDFTSAKLVDENDDLTDTTPETFTTKESGISSNNLEELIKNTSIEISLNETRSSEGTRQREHKEFRRIRP